MLNHSKGSLRVWPESELMSRGNTLDIDQGSRRADRQGCRIWMRAKERMAACRAGYRSRSVIDLVAVWPRAVVCLAIALLILLGSPSFVHSSTLPQGCTDGRMASAMEMAGHTDAAGNGAAGIPSAHQTLCALLECAAKAPDPALSTASRMVRVLPLSRLIADDHAAGVTISPGYRPPISILTV